MATNKERVVVEIVADAKGFQRSLDQANKSLRGIEKSSKATSRSLDFFRAATGVATLAVSVHRLGAAFISTNIAVQQTEKSFKAVFGAGQGAQEMEYVKGVAEEMGAEFLKLTKSYASLSAAAKGTILEGKETRAIFEAVTRAMGKLGKSSADTEGALKAIEQMINKGTITAEEWKGQLGERLPGAMSILSAALGKSTEEIMKMMEQGDILSASTLPKVTEEINRLYDDGERVEGLLQSWNRFKNTIVETAVEIDKAAGVTKGLAGGLEVLTKALDGSARAANAQAGVIKETTEQLVEQQWVLGTLLEMWLRWRSLSGDYDDFRAPTTTDSINQDSMLITPGGGLSAMGRRITGTRDDYLQGQEMDRIQGEFSELDRTHANQQWKVQNERMAQERKKAADEAERAAKKADDEATRRREKFNREMESLGQSYQALTEDMDPYLKVQNELQGRLELISETYTRVQAGMLDIEMTYEDVIRLQTKAIELADEEVKALDAKTVAGKAAAEAYEMSQVMLAEIMERNKALADEFGDAVAEAFGTFVLGQQSAREALADVLEQLAQMILRLTVLKPLAEAVSNALAGKSGGGGLFSSVLGSAIGGLFGGGATAATPAPVTNLGVAYAKGGVTSTGLPHGVYSSPTAFPINGPSSRFARGTGLLGEAGPEAIMPLKRGTDGKLGVESTGGNVYINNYAGVDVRAREMDHGTVVDIVRATVTNDLTRGGTPMSQGVNAAMRRERGRR